MPDDKFRPPTSDQQLAAQDSARGRRDGAALPTVHHVPQHRDRLVYYADNYLHLGRQGPGTALGLLMDLCKFMKGDPPNFCTEEEVARFLSVDPKQLDDLTYEYVVGFIEGAADAWREAIGRP